MPVDASPIVTLVFPVADPSGKNKKYGSDSRGGKFVYAEVADFEERVRGAATRAMVGTAWPTDPWIPALVRVTAQIHNTGHDSDAVAASCRDAMEKVLYWNDRVVCDGARGLAVRDDGGRRVVVTVELLAVRTPETARAMREKSEKARVARLLRRMRAPASAPGKHARKVRKPKWIA